jgi:diguanylate cyclase (GGDEF)-like protein/PAS domain S-box-containing protein
LARLGDSGGGELLFGSLLESAPDAIVIVGPDGRIELINAQTEKLFGYARAELVGQTVELLVPEAARSAHAAHRAGFTAAPAFRPMGANMSLRGQRKDGSTFPVEISLSPLETPAGTYVTAAVRDVSERVQVMDALAESEARLAALLNHSSELVYVVHADGSVGFANPAATAYFGDMRTVRVPGGILSKVHPADLAEAVQGLQNLPDRDGPVPFTDQRLLHADGSWRVVEGTATSLFGDRSVGGVVINAHDVTERVHGARLLAAQREVLTRVATGESLSTSLSAVADLVLEQAPGAIVQVGVADSAGPLRFVVRHDEATAPVTGSSPCAEAIAEAVQSLATVRTDFVEPETDKKRATVAVPLLARSQELLGVLSVCVTEAGQLDRLEGQVLDVGRSVAQIALERQRDLDRLVDMALHDDLTGLPNRTLFLDRLRQSLEAEKRAGSCCAVLFCDVDNFKLVNDSQGHSVGDELLRDISARIHDMLRPGDTVARFGGDEFVVLAVDLRSEEEALLVAERLVRHMRTPVKVAGADRVVTLSVGLAIASGPDVDADTLLAQADAALYRAKELGRDRAEVFDADLQQIAQARLEMEAALRSAVGTEELSLHYQPQVDLASGEVTCAEVLLRWHRPGHGAVAPGEFVPLAEETGLIVPIGEWVLRAACEQGAQWHRAGRPIALAVNVSARQLTHSDVAAAVQAALHETGLPPNLLRLEVTETAIMEDVAVLNDTLGRLTDLGVTISIDDFGTGYSSLLYLKRLPVSELKIDMGFVQGLGESVEDESIVTGIVQLARALGLGTVAEGVETQEQLTWVRRLGCSTAQGFLLGRPMPADVFGRWLTVSDPGDVPHPRPGRGVLKPS